MTTGVCGTCLYSLSAPNLHQLVLYTMYSYLFRSATETTWCHLHLNIRTVLLIFVFNLYLNWCSGENDLKFVAIVSEIKIFILDLNQEIFSLLIFLLLGNSFIVTETVRRQLLTPQIHTKITLGQADTVHSRQKAHFNCTIWESICDRDI